jgi:hypothetical protein
VDFPQDLLRAPWERADRVSRPMPTRKTSMWLSLYSVEKTKWKHAAKRSGLCLSDFIRLTVNAKLKIPTEDLIPKLEKKDSSQTSILDFCS